MNFRQNKPHFTNTRKENEEKQTEETKQIRQVINISKQASTFSAEGEFVVQQRAGEVDQTPSE